MLRHKLLGGKVQVYRRPNTNQWQCSASIDGKQYRASTKEDSLERAKEVAEDWYLGLRGKARAGILKTEKTFAAAAAQFLKEYEIITEGQRSPRWTEGHAIRIRLHLDPFFGELGLSEVTAGKVQEYRVHRMSAPETKANAKTKHQVWVKDAANSEAGADGEAPNTRPWKPPARSTLHDEVVTLRLVLKTAIRHGWLGHLPDLSPPYKTQGKIQHRPWFSPEEYRQLYEATRAYARKPFHGHYKWNAEQVHDYVLFMANTGLRPDEAKNLQHRDVAIVEDAATGERILEIEVRGKRGVGFCKSMPSAVRPYERLAARPLPGPPQGKRARIRRGEDPKAPPAPIEVKLPQPTEPVFPGNHIKLFNGVLRRAKLKLDRDGQKRTAYSLRHTYICMRLMEGADIYQIAKNCRTSVEMIEKHYAAHIKNRLDTTLINIRKPKPSTKKVEAIPAANAVPSTEPPPEDRAA